MNENDNYGVIKMNTTKEIGQDFLLMPDENPKFKHDKKWIGATELLNKDKIMEEILTKNPYYWDGHVVNGAEFIDHLGEILDKYGFIKKEGG